MPALRAICSLPSNPGTQWHVASAGIALGDMPTACGPTADVGRSRDGRSRGSEPFLAKMSHTVYSYNEPYIVECAGTPLTTKHYIDL